MSMTSSKGSRVVVSAMTITEEALCEAFDITARRLNNALKMIFTTLEEGSRE